MPIQGTPAAGDYPCCDNRTQQGSGSSSTPAPVSCHDQGIYSAPIASRNQRSLFARLRTIHFPVLRSAVIEWTMHDRSGAPVDLSGCECGSESSSASASGDCYGVRLYLRESMTNCSVRSFTGTIVDAANGKVRVELTAEENNIPGVFFAEMAFINTGLESEPIIFSNVFTLVVEQGVDQRNGPPTFAEIRLHLRDSAPGENHLIDNLKFDDAEIAMAVRRPVEYWNEQPPPVGRFTTSNFPFRYHWLEAICQQLFLIAAEHYRANNLQYQAAGVAVNDMDKENAYEMAAARRGEEWRRFVSRKKVQMNYDNGWGGVAGYY